METSWALQRLRCLAGLVGLAALAAGRIVLAGPLIADVTTDLAMYPPGAGVTIQVDLQNTTGKGFSGTVEVAISHLGPDLASLTAQAVSVTAGGTAVRRFSWQPPNTDSRGYLVRVAVKDSGGAVADVGSSAIDVSSDWRRFPRYGYEELLRGDTISVRRTVTVTGVNTSTSGSASAVWVISRRTLGRQIVHFINLLNNPSAEWRDDTGIYPPPPLRSNLAVKMEYTGAIGGGKLWWASPDIDSGAASELAFTAGSDGSAEFITFILPRLQYWSMVWL